jgi:uroporphyrinogen-III synthase
VREFFRARPAGFEFTARAWAPGPGTRDTLLAAGVDAGRIAAPARDAAQFDSETLWAQVHSEVRPGDTVLIVRGGQGEAGTGREWLSEQIAQAGGRVQALAAYTRGLPKWGAPEADAARRAAQGVLWFFSSSEAVANLAQLLPGQDWSGARALATHPRSAQAARDAGFGAVIEARPAFEAVVAALESAG